MHIDSTAHVRLNELALEGLACGVFAVDRDYRVVLWNRFMADRSGISAAEALGRSLFELFPELPVAWLKKKFETVFVLKISAFTEEFARWLRSGRALSVLILDLDHFKHINDTYGHPAGDAVLKSVAARVLACLREVDVLARYGGEEFIVRLPATTLAEAATVGERIRSAIASEKVSYAGQLIAVTASIGAAQVRVGATNHEALVHEADEALYDAKSNGRNRLIVGACAPT
ncbi:diguanylate cyclase [Paraburkholderia sp. SIMBA_030]|uniref:diguanylate cyclase n=1 Tax=Paraburkholderia sp. SIMBA_030 TaxID=3085773 RepID=UPI00397B2659